MTTYYFHFDIALKAIEAAKNKEKEICLSLDLNLTKKSWQIRGNQLIFDENTRLDINMLEPICKDKNKVFYLQDNQLIPAEVRSDGYYKLVPTDSAPTLEINGIKMHRSKDIDPLTDARLKTQHVVEPNDTVLDTCGGLGYSAIFAIKAGAAKVISTEKSRAVITLRNMNPWLKEYNNKKIELIHSDITRTIGQFDDGLFNSIIHDPPRFTSATGDLYGKKFYSELYRVLAPRGKLFHYTGSPKKIKEKDRFLQNTKKRLELIGFANVCFNKNLQGFFAAHQ
ncbi:MAG: class I SAM-dependent methyltransferase [Desulfobacula sp.]|nr:class I SAM-dependent methyltransferase [Desulfobacula sp.]